MKLEELLKHLENGPVSVTTEQLTKLKAEHKQNTLDSYMISALEANGVDNWQWYGEAQDTYKEYLKEAGIEE